MAQPAFSEEFRSESGARSVRPVDLVHLAKQCLGDENLELEILRLFDTTLATYVDRLQKAHTADELLHSVHAIRGAAAGVGAWTIADQAKALETELRDGRPLKVEWIDDLTMAAEEVRDFITRMLRNASA